MRERGHPKSAIEKFLANPRSHGQREIGKHLQKRTWEHSSREQPQRIRGRPFERPDAAKVQPVQTAKNQRTCDGRKKNVDPWEPGKS